LLELIVQQGLTHTIFYLFFWKSGSFLLRSTLIIITHYIFDEFYRDSIFLMLRFGLLFICFLLINPFFSILNSTFILFILSRCLLQYYLFILALLLAIAYFAFIILFSFFHFAIVFLPNLERSVFFWECLSYYIS
jgi:hypothetical protein